LFDNFFKRIQVRLKGSFTCTGNCIEGVGFPIDKTFVHFNIISFSRYFQMTRQVTIRQLQCLSGDERYLAVNASTDIMPSLILVLKRFVHLLNRFFIRQGYVRI